MCHFPDETLLLAGTWFYQAGKSYSCSISFSHTVLTVSGNNVLAGTGGCERTTRQLRGFQDTAQHDDHGLDMSDRSPANNGEMGSTKWRKARRGGRLLDISSACNKERTAIMTHLDDLQTSPIIPEMRGQWSQGDGVQWVVEAMTAMG